MSEARRTPQVRHQGHGEGCRSSDCIRCALDYPAEMAALARWAAEVVKQPIQPWPGIGAHADVVTLNPAEPQ